MIRDMISVFLVIGISLILLYFVWNCSQEKLFHIMTNKIVLYVIRCIGIALFLLICFVSIVSYIVDSHSSDALSLFQFLPGLFYVLVFQNIRCTKNLLKIQK